MRVYRWEVPASVWRVLLTDVCGCAMVTLELCDNLLGSNPSSHKSHIHAYKHTKHAHNLFRAVFAFDLQRLLKATKPSTSPVHQWINTLKLCIIQYTSTYKKYNLKSKKENGCNVIIFNMELNKFEKRPKMWSDDPAEAGIRETYMGSGTRW